MYSNTVLLNNLEQGGIPYDQCWHCLRVIGLMNPHASYDASGRALVCEDCRPDYRFGVRRVVCLPSGKYFEPATGEFFDDVPM